MRYLLARWAGACRWLGHMWWTEDFQDEMWGAYEMIHCRRCGDWMFAQEPYHPEPPETRFPPPEARRRKSSDSMDMTLREMVKKWHISPPNQD